MAWYKAGGGSKPKQSKTVTPSTGVQEITADSGKELEKVTVQAMPSGALKTPTVNASGLVTSGVQTSGYIGDSAEKTLQLPTWAGRTVTPTTTNQTIVASGKYTTGDQIVKGDANLKAENIKSGKSIFGVNGSAPITIVDGVEITEPLNLTKEIYNQTFKSLPNVSGGTFIYDGDLYHYSPSTYVSSMYKYNRTNDTWTSLGNGNKFFNHRTFVPYNGKIISYPYNNSEKSVFIYDTLTNYVTYGTNLRYIGSVFVCNNQINIIDTMYKHHYVSTDGISTTQLPTDTPYFMQGTLVCNMGGNVHFLGGQQSTDYYKHYMYNGTTWTQLTDLPYRVDSYGSCCEHKGELHVLSGTDTANFKKHMKYSNGSWINLTDLPRKFCNGQSFSIDGNIEMLMGGDDSSSNTGQHNAIDIIRYNPT